MSSINGESITMRWTIGLSLTLAMLMLINQNLGWHRSVNAGLAALNLLPTVVYLFKDFRALSLVSLGAGAAPCFIRAGFGYALHRKMPVVGLYFLIWLVLAVCIAVYFTMPKKMIYSSTKTIPSLKESLCYVALTLLPATYYFMVE